MSKNPRESWRIPENLKESQRILDNPGNVKESWRILENLGESWRIPDELKESQSIWEESLRMKEEKLRGLPDMEKNPREESWTTRNPNCPPGVSRKPATTGMIPGETQQGAAGVGRQG